MKKTIEKEIWIEAPVSDVYKCFTEAEAMLTWHGKEVELNPVPGGIYHVIFENGDEILGEFKELHLNERVVYFASYWGIDTLVEVDFIPKDDGTLVKLKQDFEPDVDLASFSHGWDYFLNRLEVLWN